MIERGVASMARARSLQSRLSSVLALTLCGALAVGLLVWYYRAVLSHQNAAAPARHSISPVGSADNSLPPLGPIRDPRSLTVTTDSAVAASSVPAVSREPNVSPPAESALIPAGLPIPPATNMAQPGTASSGHQTPLDRRLAGPAFAGTAGQSTGEGTPAEHPREGADHAEALAGLLTPTALSPARASELPNQRLLLAKGAFIDCTLETAIDSSLPGMTTCITATDTFSVDGKVVLLERGSKLIGETRGQVQQGSARLFVLWTEARTPTGVVVPLASPGTDALGRSGLDGEVDRHFWQRFGAAILISMVDAAAEASQRSGGTVIYDSSSSQGVATEALKGTVGIAPTITKNQGDRIQILVARDLDFRQVYQLRDSESLHQP
jgi:type IV secretion system protein VirB10